MSFACGSIACSLLALGRMRQHLTSYNTYSRSQSLISQVGSRSFWLRLRLELVLVGRPVGLPSSSARSIHIPQEGRCEAGLAIWEDRGAKRWVSRVAFINRERAYMAYREDFREQGNADTDVGFGRCRENE